MLLNQIKCTRKSNGKSQFTSGKSFKVTLSYNDKSINFIFHDNYLNESKKEDFIYSLLADAQAYEYNPTFESFCYEFGYSSDSIKALKIYKCCKKQYAKLYNLFTTIEVNQLWQELEKSGY